MNHNEGCNAWNNMARQRGRAPAWSTHLTIYRRSNGSSIRSAVMAISAETETKTQRMECTSYAHACNMIILSRPVTNVNIAPAQRIFVIFRSSKGKCNLSAMCDQVWSYAQAYVLLLYALFKTCWFLVINCEKLSDKNKLHTTVSLKWDLTRPIIIIS